MSMEPGKSIYELIGGEQTLRKLVKLFYINVQQHPAINHLFPEDITPVMEKQFMFLSQFFGGPSLFSDAFGHPMMRARHMPFPITVERADAWLDCMRRALEQTELEPDLQQFILERLKGPAYHFVNS